MLKSFNVEKEIDYFLKIFLFNKDYSFKRAICRDYIFAERHARRIRIQNNSLNKLYYNISNQNMCNRSISLKYYFKSHLIYK